MNTSLWMAVWLAYASASSESFKDPLSLIESSTYPTWEFSAAPTPNYTEQPKILAGTSFLIDSAVDPYQLMLMPMANQPNFYGRGWQVLNPTPLSSAFPMPSFAMPAPSPLVRADTSAPTWGATQPTPSLAFRASPTLYAPTVVNVVSVANPMATPLGVPMIDNASFLGSSIPAAQPIGEVRAGKMAVRQEVATPTANLVVYFHPGADGVAIARQLGLVQTGPMDPSSPNTWLLTASSPQAAARAQTTLRGLAGVQDAHQSFTGIERKGMSFFPNDPFFFPGANPPVGGPGTTTSTNFPGQWHLVNNMPNTTNNNTAVSQNLLQAWANNWTGQGITIGIVDDAIQIAHPDLAPNNTSVSGLNRWFLSSGAADPSNNPAPTAAGDNHGTSVAGVAAARGGNGIGGTGSAPFANLVAIRTNYFNNALISAINFANGIDPANAIQVKNHSYGFQAPYVAGGEILNTPLANSANAGTVNVFSAGNSRTAGNGAGDSNKLGAQNSPDVIVVGALGSNGRFANYSNYGSTLFVTAFTNVTNTTGFTGITTVDRTGSAGYNTTGSGNFASTAGGGTGLDYTNNFGGTSSSSPLAAGIIALALQANPNLLANSNGQNTTRAIKHLLARTSTIIDATDNTALSDGGWRTNAAGFTFNQNYGFGLINAQALTEQAPLYVGVTPRTIASSGTVTVVGGAIPDNNPTGISRSFTFNIPSDQLQPIEEVVVRLNVTHTYRGDLTAFLTSPSGYTSRIMNFANDSGANLNWGFTLNSFWGEDPNGTWTIRLADVFVSDVGTWNSFSIEIRMGDLVPVPEPIGLMVCGGVILLGWQWKRRRTAEAIAA